MANKPEDLGNNYYPSGWQPRIEFDEAEGKGEIVHVGTDENYKNKFNEILLEWGFDPEHFEIDGSVKASSWNAQLKGGRVETFYAFKGLVRRKNPLRDKFVAELSKQISKKPVLKQKKHGGDHSFLFMLADWQLGKSDLGVQATVDRLEVALTSAKDRIRSLRKSGVEINKVYLVGMGDLTENCHFFYDSQPFSIELTLAEQYHLARKLIMRCVDNFLPLVDEIVLAGVPGNHGEMSRSGKGSVTTNRLDNSDTMHLKICGEIMEQNPRYDKVTVDVAEGYHQVLDINGQKVAFTHGHMTGGGGDPGSKILSWWKGQMFGWLPPGDATILITAHYHHFRAIQQGDRTWLQCPAIDKSSDFSATTGLWAHPGVLTLTVSKDGWDNLSIL